MKEECLILENELFTDAPYRLGYRIESAPGCPWLCVVFSPAPSGADRSKKYVSYKALGALACNQLYIRDLHGEGGCCCLCERLDFGMADTVCRLIGSVADELGIERDHIITLGTGEGGSAALYFALRMHLGHAIAVSPVVRIGTSCSKRSGAWKVMAGPKCDRDLAVSVLDHLIPDLLVHDDSTVIHLHDNGTDTASVLLSAAPERNPALLRVYGGEQPQAHHNESLTPADYVAMTLFSVLCVDLRITRWDDSRIVMEVSGSPQGDLCLDLSDEAGRRVYLMKLHAGRNELNVDRFGTYTPVLRYPIFDIYLPLHERLMGGKQFTCRSVSLATQGEDICLRCDMPSGGKFTYDFRVFLGNDCMAQETDRPVADFVYRTAQNGVYAVELTVREASSGKEAHLRRRIAVTEHASVRKCTDPEKIAALYGAITACRYWLYDGELHVELETEDDSLTFAFALMQDKTTVSRRGYREQPEVSFPVEAGTWRVKYFVQRNNECVCGITDAIELQDTADRPKTDIRLRKLL